MLERRKYQRNDLMAFVQYTCSSDTSDTTLRGMIKNYSYSGICLIVSQPLAVGQQIIVKIMGVPSSKMATVRWQENIRKDAYEVGLEYIRYRFDPDLYSQGTPDADAPNG
jgi:c-di-GMP-binding flagellar brake protein YcgR